jgi:hypothetical protein
VFGFHMDICWGRCPSMQRYRPANDCTRLTFGTRTGRAALSTQSACAKMGAKERNRRVFQRIFRRASADLKGQSI